MGSTEDSLIQAFNFVGHLVCHQIPDRTLWIGGLPLPVCARDTGIYIGFFIGYILLSIRRKNAYGPPNLWATLFMVTPMILDAVTQFIGLRVSTNVVRLLTGLWFGTALSPFLVYLLPMVPTSRRLLLLRNFLPRDVILDDKDSWLSTKALVLGFLVDGAVFILINSMVGSVNSLFYWLIAPLLVASIIIHIFLLPIFLMASFLVYLKKRSSKT